MLLKNNVPKNTMRNIEKYFHMMVNGKIFLNTTRKKPIKKKIISVNKLNSVMETPPQTKKFKTKKNWSKVKKKL